MSTSTQLICAVTGKTLEAKGINADGSLKLAMGWKRLRGETLSPEGVAARYVRRVIFLPVLKPFGEITWKDFGSAVDECFRESARMANLAMRLYAISDVEPPTGTAGKMKLAKWKPSNEVYAKCRQLCPSHPSGSVTDLLQRLQGVYAKSRFEMQVTCRKSLPSFSRGRLPMSVRAQNWRAGKDSDGNLLCTFTLGSLDSDGVRRGPLTVILRRHNHERHAKIYQQVVEGEIESADMKIKPCKDGLGIAVTVMLPRKAVAGADGVLRVRTDPASFLIWTMDEDESRPPLHCDMVRRMIAAQDAQRQRWSDDLKFEKRWPAHVRRRMVHRRAKMLKSWENRRVNFIREAARLTVNFAKRRRAAKIEYNDSERSFSPRFAWAELSAAIANAAAADGIDFVVTAPAEPKGDQGRGPEQSDNSAVVQSPEP